MRLVEHCYHTASKMDLDAWDVGALDVLREILCYCCNCHPGYLRALQKDSLSTLTEVHRRCLKGYTPPTEAYVMLCTQVKNLAMTDRPPYQYGLLDSANLGGLPIRVHASTSGSMCRGSSGMSSDSVWKSGSE